MAAEVAMRVPLQPWAEQADAVVKAYESDAVKGLLPAEAELRLQRYGPNRLREATRRSGLVIFLRQFADWMIGLLALAASISAAIGEWQDSLLIAAIVFGNGVIGYSQERKAERAIAALKKLSQPTSRVRRDGRLDEIPAEQLVPGDLIELRGGDLVPADGRLLSAADLQTDESPLTGESMPVDKQIDAVSASAAVPERRNMLHAGTAVVRGVGKAVVTATGMHTELGRIAELLETPESTRTPLQQRLASFSKRLALIVIAICGVVFAVGLLRADETPQRMFLVAVSLAVAAIPEGLPAVITVALALGSLRMSHRKAIVRQLAAVEILGSVNVICSDKTGTLTQNKMSVSEWLPHRYDATLRAELIRAAILCNDAELSDRGEIVGSATEAAVLASAVNEKIEVNKLRSEWQRLTVFAFSSQRKRMSTLHKSPDGRHVVFVKGAAETVLERSTRLFEGGSLPTLGDDERRRLEGVLNSLTGRGRRVLGVARRDWHDQRPPESAEVAESDLAFLGFVGIVDPPRPEARDAIARCRSAGIRPVMITGDHRQTAVAVAKELSLWEEGSEVLDGESLNKLRDDELRQHVGRTSVFARVSPEHKLRIVRAHQALGNIVSMTGDGVNDAPALKQADIGVAMGVAGTDVAKEAARMVLADDNFATIVAAVEEGRIVYDNIRKFVRYMLTANLSEILLVFLAILWGLPLPLLPIHLLWINLVTDGLPALALAYERGEANLMQRPPRRRDESIFSEGLSRDIFVFGTLIGVACLGLYAYFLRRQPPDGEPLANQEYARTAAFVALAMFQLWYVLGMRSVGNSIIQAPPWQNWRLLGAFLLGLTLQIAVVYVPFVRPIFHTVPLGLADLIVSIAFSASVLVVLELTKALRRSATTAPIQ